MSETMMTVAEWHRLRDEDRMCWECGFHSPLVPVCGECEAHGKGIDAGRAAADGEIAALTTERDSLRSALAESARTIDAQEGRIQELLASFVRMTRETPYPEEDRAASVLIAEVGTLRARLATATTERDEARSWLAKAREEIEAFATPVDLMRQRIERDTALAIAAWLDAKDAMAVQQGSYAGTRAEYVVDTAREIRANAWRSK